jgi:imidazolonepropionase-like amidohydrolase
VSIPTGTRRLDVRGKYVLPGFIELHTHLANRSPEATLRALHFMDGYLRAGITSIRDLGSQIEPMKALVRAQKEGLIDSVRLYPAGQMITIIGGHGSRNGFTATGPEEWRAAVRTMFSAGFRHVKFSPQYTQAEIDAGVDEARRLGMCATAHGGGYSDTVPPTMAEMAVRAGVTSIEHLMQMRPETMNLIASRKVAIVPTLAIMRASYYALDKVSTLESLVKTRGQTNEDHEALFRRAHALGVLLGVGTDQSPTLPLAQWVPALWSATPSENYFAEMRDFVRLGMTPLEAITAATGNGARIMCRQRDLGTLEPGKLADLQVLGQDPLKSFDALGHPEIVMIGGVVHDFH